MRSCLNRLKCLVFCLSLFAMATSVNGADLSQAENNGPLYFSLVPKKNVDNQIEELQPLLQLLEEKLNRTVRIVRPQSYQSVIEGILSRTIDFAILGPASYAKARARDEEVEAFASFSSEGGKLTPPGNYYHSMLFTLKVFSIDTVEDLRGKKVALTDPASTSGAVIPNMYFTRVIQAPLEEFFASQIYTGSHDRAISSVAKGHVDAAFVSSVRIDEALRRGILDYDDVVVLWKSRPIHFDPFVFRGGLDSATKKAIKSVMLSSTPQLKSMFKVMKATGIQEVIDDDYLAIHEIIGAENRQK